MKNWSRERWRKLYLRENAQQRALWSLMQRGIQVLCVRLADDDATLATFGVDDDPIAVLLIVLGAHQAEQELAGAAIAGLLEDGFLAAEDGRVIVVNLRAAQGDEWIDPEANEAPVPSPRPATAPLSAAERARRYRAEQRRKRHGERDEDRHEASRATVTDRHEASRATPSRNSVTASRGDSQKEPSEEVLDSQSNQTNQPNSVTGARDAQSVTARDANPVTPRDVHGLAVVLDSDRETRCPADLVARAERAALFPELATSLGVDAESLRAEARSFAGYWTVGGGAGKHRRNWMGKLRQRLVERVQDGTISKTVVLRAQLQPTKLQLQLEEAERREIAELTAKAQAEYGDATSGVRTSVAQLAEAIG